MRGLRVNAKGEEGGGKDEAEDEGTCLFPVAFPLRNSSLNAELLLAPRSRAP